MWMFRLIQVIRVPHPTFWPRPQGVRTEPQKVSARSSFVSLRRSLLRKRRCSCSARTKDFRHHPSRGVNASQPVAGGHQQFGRGRGRSQEGIGVISCQGTEKAEVPHTRQIEEMIARARKRILHADEKIRLTEAARSVQGINPAP